MDIVTYCHQRLIFPLSPIEYLHPWAGSQNRKLVLWFSFLNNQIQANATMTLYREFFMIHQLKADGFHARPRSGLGQFQDGEAVLFQALCAGASGRPDAFSGLRVISKSHQHYPKSPATRRDHHLPVASASCH